MSFFLGADEGLIATFGEVALGYAAPVFFVGETEEESADGILSDTPREESTAPGVVAFLFVRSDALSRALVRKDLVEVRGTTYSIEDVRDKSFGSLEVLLRKRS